uniref:Sentrin-specific protease 1 n=1 Tax=Ceratitis capitata TaxID=7213 RepID=W8AV12_CERCA
MMYIEHTPLEDNLQYFLKNHIPASDANSILAHVRGFDEISATQLHTQTQANIAYSRYSGNLNVLHLSDTSSRIKVPNITDKDTNSYFARKKLSPPGARNRNASSPPQLNGIGNITYEEEGEEEEKYELIDIVDDPEERGDTKNNELTQESSANCVEKVQTPVTEEIIIQIEGEEDNYDYFVQPAPKQRKHSPTRAPNHQLFGQRRQSAGEPQKARKRPLRPVPAAIPIEAIQTELELPPLELIPPQPRRKRVLNGQLPLPLERCDSAESVTSSYYLAEDDVEFAGYNYTKGHRRLLENGQAEGEEELETEEDYDTYYTLPERTSGRPTNSQMGIDIFNRLRRLLNLNTDSAGNTQGEDTRKRSANYSADANPHPIKYKKVHNRFPKIITHKLDDADFDVISSFPKHEKQMLSCKSPSSASQNSLEMTQRKSLHSIEKPKYRKSMFTAPTITHRLVKNTSYADVEFSDDDEPELVRGFGVGLASGSVMRGEHTVNPLPRTINVPIMRESENARAAIMKPPPPLIEPRTGSILATSLMPEIDLTKRKPLSYSEVLRQSLQIPMGSGHVLGRRTASSASSSGATCNLRSNMWSTNARSILSHEIETEEHEKYQQLLQQVVPCLYGSTEGANARTLPKPAFGFDPPQKRSALQHVNLGNQKSVSNQRRSLTEQNSYARALKRPPLSSTINLDDDDDDGDEENNDVTLVNVRKQTPVRTALPTVIVDDDDDEISEIIDLDDDERQVVSACTKLKDQNESGPGLGANDKKKCLTRLPYVEPVNTLQERFNTSPHLKSNWLESLQSKWTEKKKSRLQEVNETVNVLEKLTAERRAAELEMQERLRKIQIVDPDLLVIDDFPEPVIEEEPEFIDLTPEHQNRIKAAVMGPPDQVLVSKFNLNITRRDIHTLLGHNWLNDEVINFYMNLLTERGEKRHEKHGLPTVYAMNTFFVPRLLSAGHGGVKRWTRKVDIFSKDIIPVPVHVGGVHWCMAIIHLKNRTIKYYDSMGTPNPTVLKALEQYLKDESLDKRKQPYDTSNFEIESVRDVPRQMNGSDCGVFSCMFAEYITRNREITFSQQNMEYFRHKMILEIVSGELLQ